VRRKFFQVLRLVGMLETKICNYRKFHDSASLGIVQLIFVWGERQPLGLVELAG